MNKRIFIILLGLILPATATFGQIQFQIQPKWSQSFGQSDHTSRDELVQMNMDSLGNLILLGFVERDSSFSDVAVQKLGPDGSLLWDYRFDSANNNDYDIPLKMAVDSTGDITVLGYSGGLLEYTFPQRGNGFLFKISKGGNLLWQVGFDTLSILPNHGSAFHCDGYQDTYGNFIVCYTPYNLGQNAPTFFISFSPEGKVLTFKKKYNIREVTSFQMELIGQTLDSLGNFVFMDYKENSQPKHFVRRINPYSGDETYHQLSLNALPSADSSNYIYFDFFRIYSDDQQNLYSGNNFTNGPLEGTFFITKIKPSGEVKYIFHSKDSTDARFDGLAPWRGFAYVTGSYIPKNKQKRAAFVWKLDENGQIAKEIHLSEQHDLTPRFLKLINGNIYWGVQDIQTGQSRLLELSSFDCSKHWAYSMHHSPDYIFSGTNIAKRADGTIAFAGTMRREKQPGSSYLSEEEFYLELLTPDSSKLLKAYQYSEKGTSYVYSNGFSIDPAGYYWIRTVEIYGPEYDIIQFAPRNYYFYKYRPDGTLVWSRKSEYQAYLQYGVDAFYFDHLGNAFTVVYGNAPGSVFLLKLNSEGEEIDSLLIPEFINLYIDTQNRLHLTTSNPVLGKPRMILLNDDLHLLQQGLEGYYPIKIFQLPGQQEVYYYLQKPAGWNETTCSIAFLKEGALMWEKKFDFSSAEYQQLVNSDLEVENGNLLSSSIWRDNAGFFQFYLHQFNLNGTYNSYLIPTIDNVFPRLGGKLSNQHIYLIYPDKIELLDNTAQFVNSATLPGITPGGYFFDQDNYIFCSSNDSLLVFGDNLTKTTTTYHPSFSNDPGKIHFNNGAELVTCGIFGDWMGGGYWYGWRWYRGSIQAFQLEKFYSSSTTEKLESYTGKLWPNPTSSLLNIETKCMNDNKIHITFVDMLGIKRNYTQQIASGVLSIDVSVLPSGFYWVFAEHARQQDYLGSIIVRH